MAMGEQKPFKDEKTEEPTAKKQEKQKSDGNIFMSQELATAITIFLGAWVLKIYGSWIFKHFYMIMTNYFSYASWFRVTPENLQNFFYSVLLILLKFLSPVMISLMVVGAISTIAQTGWVVTWKKGKWKFDKLAWKLDKLAPDKKKVADLFLNIAKISFFLMVAYHSLKDSIPFWMPFFDGPVINSWFFLCEFAFKVIMKLSVVAFIIGILDYLYKKKKWMDDLKMTKQEVKDEKKQEGDPKIKAMIKRRRFALFQKIMMESIPQADVIITNPTHFAVAIKYDQDTMEAPKVIAKGVGKLALRIKEIGAKANIPIVENKPLAQVLFKTVDVGEVVPLNLYKAVAEVLAYVYRLKNKQAA